MSKEKSQKVKRTPAKKETRTEVVTNSGIVRGKNPQHNNREIRNMFSEILKKHSELSLVENHWGALQVKRGGDLLFSARGNGKMIIPHPIWEGKGKAKTRLFKHAGNQYDYLTDIPLDKVTIKMLEDRVADPKTNKDYYAEFYKGRESESGLVIKAERAKARMGNVKKETKNKVSKKVKDLAAKREGKKIKRTPALAKAVKKVAAEAAA